MTERFAGALAVVACAACGHDIRLGSSPSVLADAAFDAVASPFTAGSYTLTFLDPAQTGCDGTLAGHEADFAGITRASSRLVDGAVTFTLAANALTIAGAPIQSAFPQASITLVPDLTSNPPTIWDASVDGGFQSGPDATQVTSLAIAVDSSTAQAASGIQGAYAQLFTTADTNGHCSVTFGALFVRN